ncbi:MAG: 2-oxo acid dehydrogenase subunit E2 [Clostridia bacterium]|nr:2-oxo acid dehydrogenase subunit E2 [Clostridia bacterium]MBR4457429.1 2-oxo acid dehydrogenase subunit E2 [Clostridia bacterium]
MFGRRRDGRRVKGIDPIVRITPYLMPMRCDAQVFLEHQIDFEAMTRYIAQQQAKGERLTHMQIIIAAYVRAISQHPEVNRFIKNKQYFARNNCSVAFTILKDPQDADSGETTVKLKFDLTDTVYDVRDRFNAAVEDSRDESTSNFVDKLVSVLFGVPGLPTLIVAIVRLLDRYGIAPRALIDELPFYVGMFITNNASIGLHHVNHHIYNFGNVGLFFGMGLIEKIAVVENGETRMKRFLPVGITADERVCGGAHYAGFFADAVRAMKDPSILEKPPEQVFFDHGLEYHVPKVGEAQKAKK